MMHQRILTVMANPESQIVKKNGVLFYKADWVLYNLIRSKLISVDKNGSNDEDDVTDKLQDSLALVTTSFWPVPGSGGEGCSGVPNAILLCHFDITSNSLSDEPGWMGQNYSISSACATSNTCILSATNHIIYEDMDMMLCGGSDAAIIPLGIGGFLACKAHS